MAKLIEAVFENGVFKPLQPVDLKEGQHVKVALPPTVVGNVTPEEEEGLRTFGYGINDKSVVVGTYVDANGVTKGFEAKY